MTSAYDEERLAELLRVLPPAPAAWVAAAQLLPPARHTLDDVVARAEADAAYRDALVADLEAALAADGWTPPAPVLDELRRRLET